MLVYKLLYNNTFCITKMAKISIVKSIRFYEYQIEKQIWLKSKGINADAFIRNAFDKEFEKQYGKHYKSKFKL